MWERTENGQTTRYYWDGDQIIAEAAVKNGDVTLTARYIRGRGLIAREDSRGKDYYIHNAHGDVVELRDRTGARLNSYSYDIWGNPKQQIEQVSQPFRYSGEMWDNATHLQYLRARWYDPSMHRFINEDTYEGDITNPLTLNLYTYVYNNPLRYTDPSGHCGISNSEGANYCRQIVSRAEHYIKLATDSVYRGSMAVAEFAVLDDVNTLLDSESSVVDKTLSGLGFVPVGKVYKGGKYLISLANKYKTISREVEITENSIRALKNVPCNCFTVGTKVQTDEGEKNIEDIEVGDKVLAKSEYDSNGELAYKEVTALYRNQRDDTIKLHVGEQIIETTDNHPFWVEGKGWVFADELQVGDKLQKADGSNLTIDKVEFVKLDKPVTVYNLRLLTTIRIM
ncbi:polymorphic toxin-type HINT domain-containing protein [Paenibacillus puerhi]|uniref:polymorphic toxin-type HINT domain-containing protein n=1 Tax=Paenibacillus puerhi TaxID=2692622 RepID=UPI001F3B3CC9|nr:polymorphic toxin-type HINT domain-containing protein [Paenibacillus puerhi]